MTRKTYSWNRNVSHHRIAITKFAVIAFILSIFVGLLMILAMGIKSDGSRDYIVLTAILGLLAAIVTWFVMFSVMGAMYKWLCEQDGRPLDPPTLPQKEPVDVFYQNKDGSFWKANSGRAGGK